jgi:hypothetical protein
MRTPDRLLSVALIVLLGASVAACGDKNDTSSATTTTSPSDAAAAQVCKAKDDLQTSVDKLTQEVSSANFGNAATALTEVGTAVSDLASAAKDLTAAQREKIQPQIDDLANEMKGITSLRGQDQIKASIDKMKSDLTSAADSLGEDLHCS